MFVSTLVLGAGGSSLNLIQALESIVILETLSVPPQCQHGCMIFDSGMMTHEESHVLCWLKNGSLC